jgi:hypothetical protein
MDKKMKRLWLKALRSGEYKQGKERLVSNDDKFCCLGVLCNVAIEHGARLKWQQDRHGVWGAASKVDKQEAFLPYDLGEAVDIEMEMQEHLARMNDHGKTFATIANYIEKHL